MFSDHISYCNLYFALAAIFYIVLGSGISFFESYIPAFLNPLIRHGKMLNEEKSLQTQQLSVPKAYFKHFYVVAAIFYTITTKEIIQIYLLERPPSKWLIELLNIICGPHRPVTVCPRNLLIAYFLFGLQIFRRLYESYFVTIFSRSAKIHVAHYIFAIFYYTFVILVILSGGQKFSEATELDRTLSSSKMTYPEIMAIVIFLWAWYHQYESNVILADGRKNTQGKIVSDSYQIPTGGWFNYISSPHYLTEILMYTALTILLYNNINWWYVYIWVIANQVVTTLLSHWWYQKTFTDFPKDRKALIPFIY